jgi:hypothetical protein
MPLTEVLKKGFLPCWNRERERERERERGEKYLILRGYEWPVLGPIKNRPLRRPRRRWNNITVGAREAEWRTDQSLVSACYWSWHLLRQCLTFRQVRVREEAVLVLSVMYVPAHASQLAPIVCMCVCVCVCVCICLCMCVCVCGFIFGVFVKFGNTPFYDRWWPTRDHRRRTVLSKHLISVIRVCVIQDFDSFCTYKR